MENNTQIRVIKLRYNDANCPLLIQVNFYGNPAEYMYSTFGLGTLVNTILLIIFTSNWME